MTQQTIPDPDLKTRITNLKISNFNWNSRALWTIAVLLVILLVNRIISPSFFSIELVNGRLIGSLISILDGAAPIMLVSIGMTFVIATEGIDLSVGTVMAISAATAVVLINKYENGATAFYYQPGIVILIALAAGALCGLWNGFLVAYLNIQPIIATLILWTSGRGIAQMITQGQSPTFTTESLAFIGRGVIFGVPFPIFLYLFVLLIAYLFVRRTALGMMIESVGINARASFYAGVNSPRIKLMVYVISGLCAALAGLIVAGEVKSADPHTAGNWVELDAILAVVIGGTALTGGRFFLGYTVLGVLIIQSLLTGLYVSKLHPTANLVVKAIVILAVLLVQSPIFRDLIKRLIRREQ